MLRLGCIIVVPPKWYIRMDDSFQWICVMCLMFWSYCGHFLRCLRKLFSVLIRTVVSLSFHICEIVFPPVIISCVLSVIHMRWFRLFLKSSKDALLEMVSISLCINVALEISICGFCDIDTCEDHMCVLSKFGSVCFRDFMSYLLNLFGPSVLMLSTLRANILCGTSFFMF